ncbi:sigma-54-dependent Fis family transcriptional regulator [Cystobacter fuscus]|uniref:Sigma-54-dependent Fis family transcriptional regulator n=1 Tax=Cystobacter fuscus TaxID=43 RepID=A0A250IZG2_9BACT|nr:sigma-54 dependent transcriptional regulator [Cystobacter fuscus]ATB37115.1 sigma-54-dependent Fis family transcriptional regulator [Cystobacter fuscus]
MTDDLTGYEDHLVVIVSRDPAVRELLRTRSESLGFDVLEFEHAQEVLGRETFDWTAVCLDLELDDLGGRDVLRHLRARDALLPILIIASDQDLHAAVQAVRRGAYDYVAKPLEGARVTQSLREAAEYRRECWRLRSLEQAGEAEPLLGRLVGQSAPMRALVRQLRRVLMAEVPVCIFGETGTGKELVARAIHEQGSRAGGPLVAVNCAAFSESLLESELFGHDRGAFTGAFTTHKGCFEQAQGGTLFLDEVGEMSASTQVRLLRTLQERTVRRVGGTVEIRVDVRIIAATHRDLPAEVKRGRFREDLYYRLAVYPLRVPPLRERASDIPLLVHHFLRRWAGGDKSRPRRVTQEVLEALVRYAWPGNVRELENVLQRAALACDGPQIELEHLPAELRALVLPAIPRVLASAREGASRPLLAEDTVVPIRELERREILKAMAVTQGSVSKAARLLGLGRATLYRRLGELHLSSAIDERSGG